MCDTCTIKCPRCKLRFVSNHPSHRICLPCWKRERDYDLTRADHALMDLQYVLLEFEAELAGWSRQGRAALSQDRIRDLIQLCHPDRHGGSEKANETTKWLLEIRAKE